MVVDLLPLEQETVLSDLLRDIVVRFGGAIDFWPLLCMSQRETGSPAPFIDRQWIALNEQIQEIREQLQDGDYEPSESVLEQIAKLHKVSGELREVFDYFINAFQVPQRELETAVMRLEHLWQDVRLRVWLLGTLIPLPEPPGLPLEKEAYYQAILDRLFDQLMVARTARNEGTI